MAKRKGYIETLREWHAGEVAEYDNPDPRCTHPTAAASGSYCWSWANFVDGDPEFKQFVDMAVGCKNCDLFKPTVIQ